MHWQHFLGKIVVVTCDFTHVKCKQTSVEKITFNNQFFLVTQFVQNYTHFTIE